MDIGVGMDPTLKLSFSEQTEVSREIARVGYTSIWTNEGGAYDGFQMCAHRWAATSGIIPGGLTTGIAVSPVSLRTPMALAMSAGTVSELTSGRFILGIGAGGIYRAPVRRSFGIGEFSVFSLMRDYLITLPKLLAGDVVTHDSVVTLEGARLGIEPAPRTPIYLGALGPRMLNLGGELADGVALNWCTPEQIAWSRERVVEAAVRVGRDSGSVKVVEYIRVCVDDDVDLARRAFTRAMLGYALGRPGARTNERHLGYRAHFDRMGFAQELAKLDDMRERGASEDELVDAFPSELARRVGYFGAAAGAADAFRTLAEGLDVAIVRVVPSRPGVDSVLAVINACRPELLKSHATVT